MKIPLAEHFHSIMGEGQWAGTPMHFIRLPGCSVGKPEVRNLSVMGGEMWEERPILPGGKKAWLCRTFNGTPFWCDTDFNKYTEVELSDLLDQTHEEHICLTGGEPLIHREVVDSLIFHSIRTDKKLHIETSGTIEPWWSRDECWTTVSPKQGWLLGAVRMADELKLLMDQSFDLKQLDPALLEHPNTYLSPINDVSESPINQTNFQKCMEVLKQMPHWRLSVQLHKYLGLR